MTYRILFRVETPETGLELMAFDTATGTFGPIIDINEGPDDGVEDTAPPAWTGEDTFLLPATDGSLATDAVFRTDGTRAGTAQVPDADIQFEAPVQSDGRLFYISSAGFMSVGPDGQEVQVLPPSGSNTPLQIDGAYTQTISAATSRMIYSLPGQADWTVYEQQPGDGVNFVTIDGAKSAARDGSILHWLGNSLQLVTSAGPKPVPLPFGGDGVTPLEMTDTRAFASDDGYLVLFNDPTMADSDIPSAAPGPHRVWELDPDTMSWSPYSRFFAETELVESRFVDVADFGSSAAAYIPGQGVLTGWARVGAQVPALVVFVDDNPPFGPTTIGDLVDLTGSVAVTSDESLYAFTALDRGGNELLYRGSGSGSSAVLNLTDAGHSGPVEMMAVGSTIYFVLEPPGQPDQLWRIEGENPAEFLTDTTVDLRAFAGAVDYNVAPEGDWVPGAAPRETAAPGTVVGRVEASDPDGDALGYTLLGDAATRGTFAVRADGTVVTTGPLDFETRDSYAASVRVSDGALSTVIEVPIRVRDVDETPAAPPSGASGAAGGVNSGSSAPPGPTNGANTLRGTSGDDRIEGLGGNDRIVGLGGPDKLFGGQGNDRLFGGGGKDRLLGDAGKDQLKGAGGNDKLFGGAGNDRLLGDAGKDVLKGGSGKDKLFGGGGNDKLFGEGGRDDLFGGGGKDTLFGGGQGDRLSGGKGADAFVFAKSDKGAVIRDFEERDVVNLRKLNTEFSELEISQKGGRAIVEAGKLTLVFAGTDADGLDAGDFLF